MAKILRITERDADGNVLTDYHPGAPIAQPAQLPRTVGLGDLVAGFAQPIAALIDAATDRFLSEQHKTALAGCSACGRRHTKLNLLCPDLRTCPFLGRLIEALPDFARRPLLDAAAKHIRATGADPVADAQPAP